MLTFICHAISRRRIKNVLRSHTSLWHDIIITHKIVIESQKINKKAKNRHFCYPPKKIQQWTFLSCADKLKKIEIHLRNFILWILKSVIKAAIHGLDLIAFVSYFNRGRKWNNISIVWYVYLKVQRMTALYKHHDSG